MALILALGLWLATGRPVPTKAAAWVQDALEVR